MSDKKIRLEGEKAVKAENFLLKGNLEVSRELHDEIDIDEKDFVINLIEKDFMKDYINYEYADKSSDLNQVSNFSEVRSIEGFDSIEDFLQTIENEVSFKD